MAEENQQEDKTEEPTAKRLEKAREEGQAIRSQDLNVAVMVMMVVITMYAFGGALIDSLLEVFSRGFVFDRRLIFSEQLFSGVVGTEIRDAFWVIAPILALTIILAIIPSATLGGFIFSFKAAAPKLSKLSLINGFKRIFGTKALIELAKAILKFLLIGSSLFIVYTMYAKDFIYLSVMALKPAIESAADMLSLGMLFVCISLILVALVDVPYQIVSFKNRMKMTKQEVKDERKEMEGQPEVRARIKQRQRDMAMQSMLEALPTADVVVTNPEHFAVALAYDPNGSDPPRVVARGADFMALRIRDRATQEGISLFEAPPLARALYFTTDVGSFIPEALYHAVAQVIAYVFSIGTFSASGEYQRPKPKVPPELDFDETGKLKDEVIQ